MDIKPIARCVHEVGGCHPNRSKALKGDLDIEGLTLRRALVGLEPMTEAAVFVLVGHQGRNDRLQGCTFEQHGEHPLLDQPCVGVERTHELPRTRPCHRVSHGPEPHIDGLRARAHRIMEAIGR